MSDLQNLYDVSLQLFHECDLTKENERENQIKKIDDLLNKRQQILDGMKPSDFKSDDSSKDKIILLSKEIDRKLTILKDTIRKDSRDVSTLKEKRNQYVNPYSSVRVDGMYYDKRS